MHDSNSVSVPVHKRNEFTNDDLYGGNEPARTWYNAMGPIASNFGPITLPPLDQKYVRGSAGDQVPDMVGMTESAATSLLQNAGFKVTVSLTSSPSARGTATATAPSGAALPGSTITLYISDGSSTPSTTTTSPSPSDTPGPR